MKGAGKVHHPFAFCRLAAPGHTGRQDDQLGIEAQVEHFGEREQAIVLAGILDLPEEQERFIDPLEPPGQIGMRGKVEVAIAGQGRLTQLRLIGHHIQEDIRRLGGRAEELGDGLDLAFGLLAAADS